MKLISTTKIPKTLGTKTIAQAEDVFSYIDSDFVKYGTDVVEKETEEINVETYQLEQDGNFEEVYKRLGSLDDLVVTQEQIIEFVKELKDIVNYYFFLFKAGQEFFVANVDVGSDGRLSVGVGRFSRDGVGDAPGAYRWVVPKLKTKPLENDYSTLSTLDTLSLEKAIEIVKENGYQVSKIM